MTSASSSADRDALARYQCRLSELLRAGCDADDIVRVLLADDSLSEFHEAVVAMRPDALDVARQLVRRHRSD